MRISYNSPVILNFTILCLAVMGLSMTVMPDLNERLFANYPHPNWLNPLTYFRLFSHVAGHADLTHLLSNFTIILLIGPILEEKYGSKNLLQMMVITALLTGLVNSLFFSTGLMGASGIAFMLILLSSFTNIVEGEIPLTFILVAILFLGREVIGSLESDDISQFAHIACGVAGSVFGRSLVKPRF